ncbi:hypothetical protein [Sulfuriflexus mobilis]|uniref:hypothetical protein n=1 Tax=Sulfuriflexus mobilis TaxID=1811807 RepID=UPI000F820F07|nr:hypothetical protein [Sulfuriflexus mobilis]
MFSRDTVNKYDDDTGTVYTCPHCGESVKFYIRDFDKHWNSKYSNLKSEDFKGAPEGKGFLDFYCQKCNTPTTVIFSLSAGGQHGEYWYTVEKVENNNAL